MEAASDIHICHVVPGLGAGGMELAMARVIRGLAAPRMRHSIVCLKEDAQIADRLPAETAIYCMHAAPNEWKLPFRLAKRLRQIRPDVIHARNWGAWPDIAIARQMVWPRIPLVLSFHGLGKAGYMPWRRRAASFFLSRSASGLFTVSEESKRLMCSKWYWPWKKVEVIPNGLDTKQFRPGSPLDSNPRIVIGTVGNLRPVKNQAMLIRACGKLVQEGMDLELRIAGEGEEEFRLRELAGSLGFADRLRLTGRVENVAEFLHGLHIFVLSSDSEQHPNALHEAMACGVPCIATRVGGVPEMLDEGRCGRILAPGDEEGLVSALRKMIADPTRRRIYSSLARERVCSQYSLETMLASYEKLYRRLAKKGGNTI